MENKSPSNEIDSNNELIKKESTPFDISKGDPTAKKDLKITNQKKQTSDIITDKPSITKKPIKPPKLEDKPFEEFICEHLIPSLRLSIEQKGILVKDIKFIEGKRPVVGGNCWMVFCELYEQKKFWLCFNKPLITSDKTILVAESNSDPSIVESFLIDEKKTTLPLLISRVLQRLNGQKWIGAN